MEYRRFGSTDLTVSAIGFGTWPIGGARYGGSDDNAARQAIEAALAAGVTCFDTAPSYGNGHAEELLGQTLGKRRHEVVVVTKGGLVWDEGSHVLGQDGTRAHLARHLDASLRRLGTDYVDLYLIHWPDVVTPFAETMAALAEFVAAGKARYVGVSNFTADQLRTAAAARPNLCLTANQVSFHLFDRRWQREVFPLCQEMGAGVIAYGTLAHGLLAGAFTRETIFDGSDWRASGSIFGQSLLTPGNFERNLDVVDRLAAIARRHGMTLPQLAIAWVLADPAVTVALVGARSASEITEAAPATAPRLSEEDLAEIETVMREAAGTALELAI